MTPFKNFSTESTWRRRLRRGGMYVAVAAMLGAQTSCSNDNNGSDWEDVTVQEPTKGVVTTLEENESGEYDIVDEQVVPNKEDARVIVRHKDGRIDSLTLAQARGLVQPQDTVAPQQNNGYHRSHGMGHVLWWGAMGYMMGRNMGSPVQSYVYRNGASTAGFMAGTGAADELRRSSVSRTVRMPAKGRSGFFRGFRGSSSS